MEDLTAIAKRKIKHILMLKGCPFCGRIPTIKAVRFGMEDFDRYGVVCYDCAICIGWEADEVAAIERWNRRADDGPSL